MGLKRSVQICIFTSKVINVSDIIHAIYDQKAHATVVSGHCAIDLNKISLQNPWNNSAK